MLAIGLGVNMNYKKIIFLMFFVICTNSLYSAEIKMSFGGEIPPYTFPKTNSGIELEIISLALSYKNHTLKPVYVPLAQVPISFKEKKVDAAMTDLGIDLRPFGGLYANPAVWYDNVFISLKQNNLTIKQPQDLDGLIVTSFQGGVHRYPKWLKHVKEKYNYFEQNNQRLQVLVLHKQRVDVILTDINIYKYNVAKLKKEKGFKAKEVKIHHFIKLNLMDYRPIFRDKKIRDDFNEGLAHIKKTGEFQAVYDKYVNNE